MAEIGTAGDVESQFVVARLVKQPNGMAGKLHTAAVVDALLEVEQEGVEAKVEREVADQASKLHPHALSPMRCEGEPSRVSTYQTLSKLSGGTS